MSEPGRGVPKPLYKQNSWSPDILRDEAWTNRRKNHFLHRGHSVTEDDLDELRACLDLGFQFDSPDLDPKLSFTFPALEIYHAVNTLSRSSSVSFSDYAASSSESPRPIVDTGEDSEMVKTRLKQWAQVVACLVTQFSPKQN